jgi:hydrogenase-4 component B
MDAIQLLLLSLILYVAGAVISLLLNGNSRAARIVSGIFGVLASVVGLAAAVLAGWRFASGQTSVINLPVPLPFGNFTLQMDGLSALMVGMITVIGFATSLFSISYLEKYEERSLGVMGFFTNLFIAMMILVVTVANAFYFLMFWEMMTLASYFLVIFEGEKKESIRAGYLYMLVAHAGGALIMLSFFVFYSHTGSFEFSTFRQAQLSPGLRSLIFLLALFGFGAKAGMVPLHFWLPLAHRAAPSNVSALMSGVMIKMGIYGILRICVDFLGASVLWWGLAVLFFGAISAVLGVLFALTEQDLKRMLAYSSVENIGIILLGVGTGMVGLSTHMPVVALLGFLAALYHALNHSFFKGLLFLGAGSVDFRVNTKNLNEMGGLARRMPWTALVFMTGALAVAALPPFNGFVSEWFTYQAFFFASGSQVFAIRLFAPLCAVLLALTGAVAAMVFIKAYSGAFSGPARTEAARQATEAPGTMLFGMGFLALGCIFLGLGAPLVAPYLSGVAGSLPNVVPLPVAQSVWVYPATDAQVLSTPLVAILLISLLTVPWLVIALYGGLKSGKRTVEAPWACGYGYSSHMSVPAGGFDQPMKATFRPIYNLRTIVLKPFNAIALRSSSARESIARAEPVVERVITRPTVRFIEYIGRHIQALQMGDVRIYCLYIILTLAILLIVIFK